MFDISIDRISESVSPIVSVQRSPPTPDMRSNLSPEMITNDAWTRSNGYMYRFMQCSAMQSKGVKPCG